MKKLISLILALALCCLLLPAVAEDASIAGTWYVSRAQSNGIDLAVVDPEAISITFNEDNTCTVVGLGAALAGTWELADGVVTITPSEDDAEAAASMSGASSFTLTDGELVYQMGTATMYLSQTPAEGLALPAAVAADSLEAFDGTWIQVAQMTSGLYGALDEAASAAAGKMILESGKGAVWMDDAEGNFAPVAGSEFEVALTDGKLYKEEAMESGYTWVTEITLREDGSIFYYYSAAMDDIVMLDLTYVFVRDAAAEEPAA